MKTNTNAQKKANIWLTSVLIIVLFLSLLLAGCRRRVKDFVPYIVPTNSGDLSFNPPDSSGLVQGTLTPPGDLPPQPVLTITLAPRGPEPTAMPDKILPTLRASEKQYTVVKGDSLASIALRHQVSVRQILDMNEIKDPNLISPGQILLIPPASANELASGFRIIPDSEVVYGPSVKDFDIESIVRQYNGKLSVYREELPDGRELSGAEIIELVANENSVNPRLLLALLQHQSGCLLSRDKDCDLEKYPLGLMSSNHKGLYKQLSWAANELLRGFHLWEKSLLAVWTLGDGEVMRIDASINPATAGLQNFFSLLQDKESFKKSISENGFYKTYNELFGYPFAFSYEPLIPVGLTQPELILPLARGDVWLLTSGPHWAWGTGSPWAALDFAPPGEEDDYGCYESDAPVLAAASGLVVRSEGSAVVIDLDGDGYEQTGWTLNYFHIAEDSAVPVGTYVATGDVIGISSCEGGISNGTHFHLARRFNGVWIEAGGAIPFNLGGWIAESYGTVYDGSLTKEGNTVEAYNGRSTINEISNP
jgi:murein DD-endopeptidase MepM/ murein hydrolase activator NlpD